MTLVLDASVAIKFYAIEPDTDAALAWIERGGRFVVPDIFLVEVLQALLRHHREARLSFGDLIGASAELAQLVEVPASSAELMPVALSLARTLDHKLHDCIYLALAQRLGCPLLTADLRLARKAKTSALAIQVLLHTDEPP